MEQILSPPAKVLKWIRSYPLLLILFAHCLFSLGIWNVQVGFGEDTTPLGLALKNAKHLTLTLDIYVDLFTFILVFVTPDPLSASIVVRFLVALLTSVSLYLVLSRFSSRLKVEAILYACLIWVASRLNAPVIQYTNISGFAFSIMLLGIYFLFSKRRIMGLVGFAFFSVLAISLRPEWFAPTILIVLFLVGEAFWRWLQDGDHGNKVAKAACGFALVLIVVGTMPFVLPRLRPAMSGVDRYLLLGLGQCYANFAKTEHPEQQYDPMVEYKLVLNRTFGKPASFVDAIRNNPHEAMRYFRLNTWNNLRNVPDELLSTRSGHATPLIGRPHSILFEGILLAGGFCAAVRFRRSKSLFYRPPQSETGEGNSRDLSESDYEFARKVVILVLLCSASSVAILMLVGSPRYWISIVPLFYLAIAYCCDALMNAVRSVRFEILIMVCALVFFCRPNFLSRKAYHYEVRAMRKVAPLVRVHPVIAALWAQPLRVYGFSGEAEGVSAWDGIKAEDIVAGRFDILMVNSGLRASRTWAEQRTFFERLEEAPEHYGLVKLQGLDIGPRAVYYRPVVLGKQENRP